MNTDVKKVLAATAMAKIDMARDLIEQTVPTVDHLHEDGMMVQCAQNILADIAWLYEMLADIADPQEGEE